MTLSLEQVLKLIEEGKFYKSTITRSYIKYNTSNARTKDGKRSACLVFALNLATLIAILATVAVVVRTLWRVLA